MSFYMELNQLKIIFPNSAEEEDGRNFWHTNKLEEFYPEEVYQHKCFNSSELLCWLCWAQKLIENALVSYDSSTLRWDQPISLKKKNKLKPQHCKQKPGY